jgi:hypothetical protein
MNSPSTNVAVMYSSENSIRDAKPSSKPPPVNTRPFFAPTALTSSEKLDAYRPLSSPSTLSPFTHTSMAPPNQPFGVLTPDPVLVSDADLLLNLHSPFPSASPAATRSTHMRTTSAPENTQLRHSPSLSGYPTPSDNTFGDMVIDVQDIDMSLLGTDMMPWDLEYLPCDLMGFGEGVFENGDGGENDGGGG